MRLRRAQRALFDVDRLELRVARGLSLLLVHQPEHPAETLLEVEVRGELRLAALDLDRGLLAELRRSARGLHREHLESRAALDGSGLDLARQGHRSTLGDLDRTEAHARLRLCLHGHLDGTRTGRDYLLGILIFGL